MKFKSATLIVITLISFFIDSCNQVNQDSIVPKENPEMEIDLDSLQKGMDNSRAISKVFEISKDTIFASRHYGGLVYSIDSGENWNEIINSYRFNDFTISKEGILIGLEYWIGIHEPDYSRLYISKNFGEDWEKIKFDTQTFFPVKIISKPYDNLKLQTDLKEVFELVNNDYSKGWKKTNPIKKEKENSSKISYNDKNNRNVFLYTENKNRIDTIGKLKLFNHIENLITLNHHTYLNGEGRNLGEDAYFSCFAIINEKNELKEFKFPGSYSYMTKTDLGRIFLYNDEGIFQVKKDTLIQIY